MGGTKTIFHSTQQSMAGKSVTFKGEHRIHQVLKHLGARQHPLFGHMSHEEESRVLALGQTLK